MIINSTQISQIELTGVSFIREYPFNQNNIPTINKFFKKI